MAHLTKREKEVLYYLKKDPTISQEELADRMKITRSAAAVHISNLMRKGYILGRGYILDERTGILVIGRTWLEIAAQLDGPRIDVSYGGMGYLISSELIRQRLTPTLFTVLGQDEIGDQIYQHLSQMGVNVQHIVRTRSYTTPKKLLVREGNNNLYQVIEHNKDFKLNKKAQNVRDDLMRSAKVLLLDGALVETEIDHLCAQIKEYGVLTTIIGSPLTWFQKKGLFMCPQLFLVCHDYELMDFSEGFQKGVPESSFPVCREIVSNGLAALIVIFGQQGLILATKKETVFLPASPLKGTGTEISITAGIAGGLAAGYEFRLAARRALGKSEMS
ncbi:MAG: PfkB family carbohydrate kinase [Syntrophaceticus sp.]